MSRWMSFWQDQLWRLRDYLLQKYPGNQLVMKKAITEFAALYARGDNWHELDLERGNLGYGWWHYAIIRTLKPKRVLAIGSKYGFIPAVCALACRDNGFGMVDFVDAGFDEKDPYDEKRHWGGVGFWKTVNANSYFGAYGLEKFIKLHVMTTAAFAKKFPKRNWGYVYVDGDHSYKGVKGDFRRFWPRLEKNGFMSFHDALSKEETGADLIYGVSAFWKELHKQKQSGFIVPGQCGLGVIQKN